MQLSELFKNTFVLGFGHILARAIGFLLVLIHTARYSPSDFGKYTLVFVFIAFGTCVFSHGVDSAILKFYGQSKKVENQQSFASTAIWWHILSSVALGVVFSILVFYDGFHYFSSNKLVLLSVLGIMIFDTLIMDYKVLLRLNQKNLFFVLIEIFNASLTVLLNYIYIYELHMPYEYIFYINLLISFIVFLILFFKNINFLFIPPDFSQLKHILLFALPMLFSSISNIINELSDRYMLSMFSKNSEYDVGIYSANYKLGIFMLLAVTGFKFAWQPYFINQQNLDDRTNRFSSVGTYYVMIASYILIVCSFNIHLIAPYILKQEEYLVGLKIVPIVLLAYLIQGLAQMQVPGIYFKNKSYVLPWIHGLTALLNISLNYILITNYGWEGAAFATLISYVFYVLIQNIIVNQFFTIKWEFFKLFKIFMLVCLFFVGFNWLQSTLFNLLSIILFPASLIICHLLPVGELKQIITSLRPEK